MRIESETTQQVRIVMSCEKAEHLMAGLVEHAQELGEHARELQTELETVGVRPFAEPRHIRHEWP